MGQLKLVAILKEDFQDGLNIQMKLLSGHWGLPILDVNCLLLTVGVKKARFRVCALLGDMVVQGMW